MADQSIEEQFGISTHFMPATHGETLEQAADAVLDAGFAGFEIVPADAQAQIGHPHNIPNVGLWPREFLPEQRQVLRQRLAGFRFSTVHAPHLDLNIASANRGIREESVRQYFECMDLAIDLGVEIVTFHSGHATPGFIRPEEELLAHEVSFARRAVEYAERRALRVGYETGAVGRLRRVFAEVPDMGVNIDLGHTAMQGVDPAALIEEFADRLVEIHFNGVVHYWGGFMEHVPVNRNNVIDYPAVAAAVRKVGFRGPIVFELQGNDIAQVIAVCAEAREMLRGLWGGTLTMEQRWYVGD
ncbi:MAG: sugar phosphate isomerase/epimerase [Armatimonadota bacterium]|nr:MAG: sugar phosphate isomerase/epimerase [Armatimonadota bacterium]